MRSFDEISYLRQIGGGVLRRTDHPELSSTLDWLVRTGRLIALLPGVYTDPADRSDPWIRVRAASLRHPDAVVVGAAAAQFTFWPELGVHEIELATPRKVRDAPGYRFSRRRVPVDDVITRNGVRWASPSVTALDLAVSTGANSIDRALRARAVTLDSLHGALRAGRCRPGNRDRRAILLDSRDEPWSAAERLSHRLLRKNRIDGWKANLPVTVAGQRYFIDIAFKALKVAIEIDGRIHETDQELFESDRRRQNALVLAGWRVIRFTWAMLRDEPEIFIATVRAALRPWAAARPPEW